MTIVSLSTGKGSGGGTTVPVKSITVMLRATPLETRFSIDDGPLQDNPFIGQFSSDERDHIIRALAPGYPPKQETVKFNDDVSVRFTLSNKK